MSESLTHALKLALEAFERYDEAEALGKLGLAWSECRAERVDLLGWRLRELVLRPPMGWGAPREREPRPGPPREPGPELGAEASTLCAALEAAITRREEALARRAPLLEELFARVVADPDDDGARLVLADRLLEQGDRMGEFINLQCQPGSNEHQAVLRLREHVERWLALLEPAPMEVRFSRGFPVSAGVSVMRKERLPPPGRFWGTVREIDLKWHYDEAMAEWLAHPHLRNVTVLRDVSAGLSVRLGTHQLPVRKLDTDCAQPAQVEAQLASLASLPHLVRLKLRGGGAEVVRRYADSPLAQRLERFETGPEWSWWLDVRPAEEVPVLAELHREASCQELAEAIRAAAGFGNSALRIHSRLQLGAHGRLLLEGAAAAYARVEWDVPGSQ